MRAGRCRTQAGWLVVSDFQCGCIGGFASSGCSFFSLLHGGCMAWQPARDCLLAGLNEYWDCWPCLHPFPSPLSLLRCRHPQVTLSSLNRHCLATRADVGLPKATVLAQHFKGTLAADGHSEASCDCTLCVDALLCMSSGMCWACYYSQARPGSLRLCTPCRANRCCFSALPARLHTSAPCTCACAPACRPSTLQHMSGPLCLCPCLPACLPSAPLSGPQVLFPRLPWRRGCRCTPGKARRHCWVGGPTL